MGRWPQWVRRRVTLRVSTRRRWCWHKPGQSRRVVARRQVRQVAAPGQAHLEATMVPLQAVHVAVEEVLELRREKADLLNPTAEVVAKWRVHELVAVKGP